MERMRTFVGSNRKFIIIMVAFAMMIALSGCSSKSQTTAKTIIDQMKENKDLSKRIGKIVDYKTKSEDPNGKLGEANYYTSKVGFADSEIEGKITDPYTGGTIEVFNNKEDVKIRLSYIEHVYTKIDENFPIEKYGDVNVYTDGELQKWLISHQGNAIIMVNLNIEKKVVDKYFEVFKDVVSKAEFTQENVPDKKTIEKLLKEKTDEVDGSMPEIVAQVNGILDQFAIATNQKITDIEADINGGLFASATTSIAELRTSIKDMNIGYFADKYQGWETTLSTFESTISTKKAEAQAAAAKEAELAKNKYSAGSYKVGVDLPAGEYVLIGSGYFEINTDSTGTLDSIVANDNFINNSIITVKDGQYLKVSRAVFYNISLNPPVSTDDSGMFKVGLHIPAGEYKLISTRSSGYVEVNNSSLHNLGGIVSNDNFSGEKYITVKDGQYLKLSGCRIVK